MDISRPNLRLDSAVSVVKDIRENLRVGYEDARELQKNLLNALKRLSVDIYSTDTHFLNELIQNADDNSYDCATPTFRVRWSNRFLVSENKW